METESAATTCSRCKLLEAEVAALKKLVAEQAETIRDLSAKFDAAIRARKRQAAPFRKSKSQKKPEQEHKKSGRPAEHPVANRPEPTPDQINQTIDVRVDHCPDCCVALENLHTEVQYQTDIPEIKPTIHKFVIQVGHCPCCGKRVQGAHPEQTSQAVGAANQTIGPNALGVASELKYRLGMPFRKISAFFQSAFNLTISPGTIVRATQRVAQKSACLISILKMQLPHQKVVYVDETGWWLGGDRRYLHVFCTEDMVLFKVADRSKNTALEMLGSDFANTLSCDGYAGYDVFSTARCNAHPLRRVRDLMEAYPKKYADLQAIYNLLSAGMHLSKTRIEILPSDYARQVREHVMELEVWISEHRADPRTEVTRLAKHLDKYSLEFNKHLFDSQIPSTNNYAERSLRGAVLLRKVGCCNRTDRGVQAFEILSSVLATFQKRAIDFTEWLKHRFAITGPQFIPPQLLPANFPRIILRQ